jgi:thioredoxin reductase
MNEIRDTVVIGAGPQGLAVAAHLRASGRQPLVFGEPLGFWKHHMPDAMVLRSMPRASSISEPSRIQTFPRFAANHGSMEVPIPIADFIAYGASFQRDLVPDVDTRRVSAVETEEDRFRLSLDDETAIEARRVIVAAGIAPFRYIPAPFRSVPNEVASHTFDHSSLGRFAGRCVVVIGGGQSALESGAILRETGADVEVLVRAPRVRWLRELAKDAYARRSVTARLIDAATPATGVGPPGLNWIVGIPDLYRSLPTPLRRYVARRAIPPAGANWLRSRLEGVPIRTGVAVRTVTQANGGIRLALSDGTERTPDHALLATGYAPDVDRYPFLSPAIRQSITSVAGYPVLGPGFESSVRGLYFVGAIASYSYGPIMRFVVGTAFTAPTVAAHVTGRIPPAFLRAW